MNENELMYSRAAALSGKDFAKGIDTIATTDSPTLVADWANMRVIREILPMRYAVLPENDKVPLLDTHSRDSIEQIKGSARNWSTGDHQLDCKCFISDSETGLRAKIDEGHIDSVSIGYKTDNAKTVEIGKGKTENIDGQEYKNDFADSRPLVIRKWWSVKELSIVPIGADANAKFREVPDVLARVEELQDEIKKLREELSTKQKYNKGYYQRKLQLINSKLKLT